MIARQATGAALIGLGALLLLAAVANLFNVDSQPRWLLGLFALAGVLGLGAGVALFRGSER